MRAIASLPPARRAIAILGVVSVALLVAIASNSVRWIGTTFPAFFVMENRVIASAALNEWLTVDRKELFQHQVLAVDGRAVDSAATIYGAVRSLPADTEHVYSLRSPDGELRTIAVRSRRFSGWDHLRLFGAYLLAGIGFIATGLVVAYLMPANGAAQGLLSCGLTVGLFALTGADLYGPHWFFRLHVLAEALAPVGLIHLALVFPTERLGRYRRWVLLGLFSAAAIFALAYETQLDSAAAYTRLHRYAEAGQGLTACFLILSVIWGFVSSTSPLVRRRIGVVALGTVAGFLLPGILIGASAVVGGSVPINFSAFTVFLFPLSVGYAALKRDLFDIDDVIRQAITYSLVFLSVGGTYVGLMLLVGTLVPTDALLMASPVVFATLNVAMVFAVVPLRARVQVAVDRAFFRHTYDGQEELSRLSATLATLAGVDAIRREIERTIDHTLSPVKVAMIVREEDGILRHRQGDETTIDAPELPPDMADRLTNGETLARYEWDDGTGDEVPAVWSDLGAELLVPILDGRGLTGLLAVGGRRSGHIFTGRDVAFLRAMANHAALAVEDARLVLQLERKQASLIRADRLATLGRLASGMAHELNNPLGAVLSSLSVLVDLGREYASSIDDPNVQPEDHRMIASEIVDNAIKAGQWTTKARDYVRGITKQARDSHSGPSQRFALHDVVAHVRSLLAHRLASSSCEVEFEETPAGIGVVGDPGPLGQVLTNLIANALDAYDDAHHPGPRRIRIVATTDRTKVSLAVEDWAGGIPEDVLPRIFDELYTTKDAGRGTGLGLWISRNLIEEAFTGTLVVASKAGQGTTFTMTLPASPAGESEESPAASAPSLAASNLCDVGSRYGSAA